MNTMKNWRHLITGITTLAVVSLGSYALAEETVGPDKDCKGKHSFHQHMKGERPIEHMARFLELTDEQKQTLAAHRDEQRTQYREQRQQIRQTQRALHDAVANNIARCLAKNAGRDLMQDVLDAIEFKRVPCIRTTLETRDDIILGGHYVHNLSFAFISPLKA